MPDAGPQSGDRSPAAVLRELWQVLLQVPHVGDDSHFFELGGHSMLATRLMSRTRRALGADLPMALVFDHPVFADFLSQALAAAPASRSAPAAVLRPSGRSSGPLSLQQQQLMVVEAAIGPSPLNNTCTVVELGAEVVGPVLARALQVLVLRHPALRTVVRPTFDGAPQEIRPARSVGPVDMVEFDVSALDDVEQTTRIRRALRRARLTAFDLTTGCLLRAPLFRRGGPADVLALHTHHLAADGVSLAVLQGDLAAVYSALRRGRDPDHGRPGLTYVDYALWQRDRWQEIVARSRPHWRAVVETLAGEPRSGSPPAGPGIRSTRCSARVDPAVMADLRRWMVADGGTEFTVLATAVATALATFAGRYSAGIGTLLANRTVPELERVVGPFATSSLLAVRARPDATPRQLLREVRGQLLEAERCADVPAEVLLAEPAAAAGVPSGELADIVVTMGTGPSEPAPDGEDLSMRTLGDDGAALVESLAGPTPSLVAFPRETGALDLVMEWPDGQASDASAELLSRTVAALRRFAAAPDGTIESI